MHTKEQIGEELKEKIARREPISFIGRWSHALYYKHLSDLDFDLDFGEFLIQLGTMEMGPEFELSYEKLNEIADRLIAGEDVKL